MEAHDISIPASETVLGCKLRSLQPASSSSSEKKAKTELAFKFQPPARVDLVGSYLLKTVTRPLLNIDLAIQMPKPSFFDKDYLNFRYFDKRAAYLAEVKSHLEKHDLFSTVEVAYLHDDPLKPILTITPPSDVKVRL